MTKKIILWNNLYNKNCCSSCKVICKPCNVKFNKDASGNLVNYFVNNKKIIIKSNSFSLSSVFLINGKRMRKNEYVILKRVTSSQKFTEIAYYNNILDKYFFAIHNNTNKTKCLKLPIDKGEPFYGRLIKNNKINYKNVLLQI